MAAISLKLPSQRSVAKDTLVTHMQAHCMLCSNDFAAFMCARQNLLLDLVAGVTNIATPASNIAYDEGEHLSPATARDSGLELTNSE